MIVNRTRRLENVKGDTTHFIICFWLIAFCHFGARNGWLIVTCHCVLYSGQLPTNRKGFPENIIPTIT